MYNSSFYGHKRSFKSFQKQPQMQPKISSMRPETAGEKDDAINYASLLSYITEKIRTNFKEHGETSLHRDST